MGYNYNVYANGFGTNICWTFTTLLRNIVKQKKAVFTVLIDGAGRGTANVRNGSSNLRVSSGKITSKLCPNCDAWLPIVEFTLTRTGNYSTYCRECFYEFRSDGNTKKMGYIKTKRDENGLLMFQCSKCKDFKYVVEYSRDTARGGRSYRCQICEKARHKQYYYTKKETNGSSRDE